MEEAWQDRGFSDISMRWNQEEQVVWEMISWDLTAEEMW